MKKVNKKALIASTVAMAVLPFTTGKAESNGDWVARSVDEIRADISTSENKQTNLHDQIWGYFKHDCGSFEC